MNDNLYALEKYGESYRQRRLQDAEPSRLLHELRAETAGRPAWCGPALKLARGLIALGQRLEMLAEAEPKPSCETC